MKFQKNKTIREFYNLYFKSDLGTSLRDSQIEKDLYHNNLMFAIISAGMLCLLSLIGLVGSSPVSAGFILPPFNATAVYLTVLTVNLVLFIRLSVELTHFSADNEEKAVKRAKIVFSWFTGVNMVMATLTLFSTQPDSSFFFEYILVTSIIYLVPNAEVRVQARNTVINIAALVIALFAIHYVIAWQDVVDVVMLHTLCTFVNWFRLMIFVRFEKIKFSIEEEKNRFYQDSRTDGLTEMLNRTALRNDFPTYIDQDVCAALIDLDYFKRYNDTFGHDYGDQVLVQISRSMRHIFNDQTDHCYRYGGDEFLILSTAQDPKAFLQKLVELEKSSANYKGKMQIHCSIGYYRGVPQSERHLREIIKIADNYLYRAKSEGESHIMGDFPEGERQPITVQQNSGVDELTGLIDMRAFFAAMEEKRREKRDIQKQGELVVLFFNFVNFRMINLHYGTAAGDEYLRKIAATLKLCFPNGHVARMGEDHFAALTDTRRLEEKIDNVHRHLQRVLPNSIECCIGASVWEDDAVTPDIITSQAQAAADANRNQTGKKFAIYTQQIGKSLETTEYVISNIDKAIDKGWIVVYYQPIVRAISNRLCGMEALARWQDPEKGMLPPAAFIEPLEKSNQIWKLDLCVIRQAVHQIAAQSSSGIAEIPVSINLSRTDFLSCDIFSEIEALVKAASIPRYMLHIEVTESTMTSKGNGVIETLQSFREAGYEIWMDDFGSGYSTLNLLKDYSFDVLKMDMVFLKNDSHRSRNIIASVIDMDKKIGIRTLAEGVETAEQVAFLKKAGCEKLQGYFFGKPQPFDAMMKNWRAKGLDIETAEQRSCYNTLGQVNFMTDMPLVVVESRKDVFHLLLANDPALDLIHNDGFADLAALEKTLSNQKNVASRELLKAAKDAAISKRQGRLFTPFNGQKRQLNYRFIGQYDDTYLFVVIVYNRVAFEKKQPIERQILMNLLYFFRYIFSIDVKKMTIQSLHLIGASEEKPYATPLMDSTGHYASLLPDIFPADRKRYDAFMCPETLKDRLMQAEYGILRDTFRTRDANGRYVWMAHRLLLAPNAGGRQILYVIYVADRQAMALLAGVDDPSSAPNRPKAEN